MLTVPSVQGPEPRPSMMTQRHLPAFHAPHQADSTDARCRRLKTPTPRFAGFAGQRGPTAKVSLQFCRGQASSSLPVPQHPSLPSPPILPQDRQPRGLSTVPASWQRSRRAPQAVGKMWASEQNQAEVQTVLYRLDPEQDTCLL